MQFVQTGPGLRKFLGNHFLDILILASVESLLEIYEQN